MKNKLNKGDIDMDRAMAERDFRKNPPSFEPGQGNLDGWNLDESKGVTANADPLNSVDPSLLGGGVDPSDWTGGSNMNVNNMLNQTPGTVNMSQEAGNNSGQQVGEYYTEGEKLLIAVVKGIITAVPKVVGFAIPKIKEFRDEIREAFEDNSIEDRYLFGRRMFISGWICCGVGFALLLLSFVSSSIRLDACLSVIVGSLFAVIPGSIVVFSYQERYIASVKAKVENDDSFGNGEDHEEDYNEDYGEGDNESYQGGYDSDYGDGMSDDFLENPPSDISDSDDVDDDMFNFSGEDDDDEDLFSGWGDDDEEDEKVEGNYEGDINIDSELEKVKDTDIPVGVWTRQYLVETFSNVLPLINPQFSDFHEISESSDDFVEYEEILREAATSAGITNEEDLPTLLNLRESMMIVQLKASRTPKCKGKEETIANEIVAIYKYDDYGKEIDSRKSAFAYVTNVSSTFFINIFLGRVPMVSLGDVYRKEKSFILDTQNKMPYIWGVNEMGDVLKCDLYRTYSFIISGTPRAGKSWKVQSLLLQMCMYMSPEELNIYVFDPKYTDSDYYRMSMLLPHFKGFEHEPSKVLAKLKELTSEEVDEDKNIVGESEKRRRMMFKYGEKDFLDLKKHHPEVKMPFIYVVMDEMKNLTSQFSREEATEFQIVLGGFVSKLPNRGYRVILIPHRITNEIISKQLSALISCRAAFMAQFSDLATGLDVTHKTFPYELPNRGDMALKDFNINGNKPTYCHAEVISSSGDTNSDIYRFVGEVWKKLCPGCEKDMIKPEEILNDVDGNGERTERKPVEWNFDSSDYEEPDERVENEMSVDDLGSDDDDIGSFWD